MWMRKIKNEGITRNCSLISVGREKITSTRDQIERTLYILDEEERIRRGIIDELDCRRHGILSHVEKNDEMTKRCVTNGYLVLVLVLRLLPQLVHFITKNCCMT
mgnify:CR=1 FL=1